RWFWLRYAVSPPGLGGLLVQLPPVGVLCGFLSAQASDLPKKFLYWGGCCCSHCSHSVCPSGSHSFPCSSIRFAGDALLAVFAVAPVGLQARGVGARRRARRGPPPPGCPGSRIGTSQCAALLSVRYMVFHGIA